MDKLMEIKNLGVNFKTNSGLVQAVRGVSFNILPGETLAVVGESGSGKSVTAKTLMGLQEQGLLTEESEIYFSGKNILDYSEDEMNCYRGNDVSMIFQDALTALNPTMKIGKQIAENLTNHRDLSNEEVKAKCIDALHQVGIADAETSLNKYPHELSGGMRQRVMIAMAIITKPKLLIADEPTTALDVTIQAQILELMKKIQEETGMSILLITHDMGVVAGMADRVVVMYAGQLVEEGTVDEIFYKREHPYTWALLNSVPRIDLEDKKKLITIEGSLPDTVDVPKGCGFYSRCPYAMEICELNEPEMDFLSPSHKIKCWLQNDLADKSHVPFLLGGSKDE